MKARIFINSAGSRLQYLLYTLLYELKWDEDCRKAREGAPLVCQYSQDDSCLAASRLTKVAARPFLHVPIMIMTPLHAMVIPSQAFVSSQSDGDDGKGGLQAFLRPLQLMR